MSGTPAADDAAAPVLRVVSGRPDARELAALVAVLVARAGAQRGAGTGTGVPAPPLWGAPATLVRPGGAVRAGGWGGASATLRG